MRGALQGLRSPGRRCPLVDSLWNLRVGLSTSRADSNPDRPPRGWGGEGACLIRDPAGIRLLGPEGVSGCPRGSQVSTGGPFSCQRPSKESKSPLWGRVLGRPAVSCTHSQAEAARLPQLLSAGPGTGGSPLSELPPTHTACTRGPARVWERGLDSHLCRQDPGRAPEAPRLPSGLGPGTAQPVGEKALPGPAWGTGQMKSLPHSRGRSPPAAHTPVPGALSFPSCPAPEPPPPPQGTSL